MQILKTWATNPVWISQCPKWRKDTRPKCPSEAVGTPHTGGTSISRDHHQNLEQVPWKDFGKRKTMQVDLITPNIPAAHDLRVVQLTAYAMRTFHQMQCVLFPWSIRLHTHLGTHTTCSGFLAIFEILPPHPPYLGTRPTHLSFFYSTPKHKIYALICFELKSSC